MVDARDRALTEQVGRLADLVEQDKTTTAVIEILDKSGPLAALLAAMVMQEIAMTSHPESTWRGSELSECSRKFIKELARQASVLEPV